MKIEKGKRVRVEAKLQVVGGEVIEESAVEYFQGKGTMLPALEALLEGAQSGEVKVGVLKAKDAFGNEALLPTKKLPRSEFPKDATLAVGELFNARGPSGMDVRFRVISIDGDEIEVKFLHALSDKDLSYRLRVLSVTDPLPPPLPGEAVLDEE